VSSAFVRLHNGWPGLGFVRRLRSYATGTDTLGLSNRVRWVRRRAEVLGRRSLGRNERDDYLVIVDACLRFHHLVVVGKSLASDPCTTCARFRAPSISSASVSGSEEVPTLRRGPPDVRLATLHDPTDGRSAPDAAIDRTSYEKREREPDADSWAWWARAFSAEARTFWLNSCPLR
jgi:hypothetical protein